MDFKTFASSIFFFLNVSYDDKRETELHHVTEFTQVSIFSHTSIARNPKTGSEIVESNKSPGAFFSELHARIEGGAFQWISSRSALCFIQLGLLVLQSWSSPQPSGGGVWIFLANQRVTPSSDADDGKRMVLLN